MAERNLLPSSEAEESSEFFHYYDRHPTREDLMGESAVQSRLVQYLLNVLNWYARSENWLILSNLNIYRQRQRLEYPLAPDLALFKGVKLSAAELRRLRSWRLYEPDRPPPQVLFEIGSEATWREDVERKPAKYAALGVREYYTYDPNEPALAPLGERLRGWWLIEGHMTERVHDGQGRLWSAELDSWLVGDEAMLRLVDRQGQRRLTEGEAERRATEAERRAAEAERRAKEAAWAKLRALGIDPGTLEAEDDHGEDS